MNIDVERRRKPRIPICWSTVLMTPQGPKRGITEDISLGGILILCSETIETDDELEIAIRMSKNDEMSITVKKIWSHKLLAEDSIYYEIGFRFIKISPRNQKFIDSLVTEYLQV